MLSDLVVAIGRLVLGLSVLQLLAELGAAKVDLALLFFFLADSRPKCQRTIGHSTEQCARQIAYRKCQGIDARS